MRVKSLKALGNGAWKIHAATPVKPLNPTVNRPKVDNSLIQKMLWNEVKLRWPELAEAEYKNAVPGRKFRLDIAIPSVKLAIEVDGWAYHGKFKEDFTKDRIRQNLLVINGWRILRFTANQVRTEMPMCIEQIESAINAKLS